MTFDFVGASLLKFECFIILCASIRQPSQKLWSFVIARAYFLNVEHLDMLWAAIGRLCQK